MLNRRLWVVREGLFSAEQGLWAWVIIVIELWEIAIGGIRARVIRNSECHARAGVLFAGSDEVGPVRLMTAPDFGQ